MLCGFECVDGGERVEIVVLRVWVEVRRFEDGVVGARVGVRERELCGICVDGGGGGKSECVEKF